MHDLTAYDAAAEAATADPFTRFLDRAESIRVRHVIAGALELGKAAVEELYGGDLSLVHVRGAAQDNPLDQLLVQHGARMDFLRLTVDRVRAAMRAYEVDLTLPITVQGHLLPGQLTALAVIPSTADRAELALRAQEHAWTVEQTQDHVGRFREEAGLKGKGGRKPIPAPVKNASAAARSLRAMGTPADVAKLPAGARAALRKELQAMKASLERWLKRL